jgi:hypothetical protein
MGAVGSCSTSSDRGLVGRWSLDDDFHDTRAVRWTAAASSQSRGNPLRVEGGGAVGDRERYRLTMERETRFELATSTLARLHSTTELLPQNCRRF